MPEVKNPLVCETGFLDGKPTYSFKYAIPIALLNKTTDVYLLIDISET